MVVYGGSRYLCNFNVLCMYIISLLPPWGVIIGRGESRGSYRLVKTFSNNIFLTKSITCPCCGEAKGLAIKGLVNCLMLQNTLVYHMYYLHNHTGY